MSRFEYGLYQRFGDVWFWRWLLHIEWRWRMFTDAVPRCLAWWLPRKVALWAFIRVMAATGENPDRLTYASAYDAWEAGAGK